MPGNASGIGKTERGFRSPDIVGKQLAADRRFRAGVAADALTEPTGNADRRGRHGLALHLCGPLRMVLAIDQPFGMLRLADERDGTLNAWHIEPATA